MRRSPTLRPPTVKFLYTSNDVLVKVRDSIKMKRHQARIMARTGEESGEMVDETINLDDRQVLTPAFNMTMDRVYFSVCDYGGGRENDL